MRAFALSLCILTASANSKWDTEFAYHTFVTGADDQYELFWTANEEACELEIGLAVATDGWVAFGLSAHGIGMNNADIVMAWITESGEYILQNRIGAGKFMPQLFEDQSQITAVEGWKEDVNGTTMTYVRFIKPLYPDFDSSAVSVTVGSSRIIWAWRDGELSADSTPGYHTNCGESGCRGIETVNLLQGESFDAELPDDAVYHDVYMENVEVPSKDTTYYCSLIELPQLDDIHHIVRFDPIVTEENLAVVHHFVLYGCPEGTMDEEALKHVGKGSDCDALNTNMPGVSCRGGGLLYAWAIGGKEWYLPDHVGMEIGGNNPDSIRYALLETHYDNPANKEGIVDSSGLRLWYTPTLKENSAGLLQIGVPHYASGQFIPPGMPTVNNHGYCFADCLSQGIEGTDTDGSGDRIYAFANTLHTHVFGTAITLKHIRDGKELRPMDINEAYDFNYQQMVPFSEEVEILPGDSLIVDCVYDSSSASDMIYGGESTNEEMCYTFLMVYPKPKLSYCTSSFVGSGHPKYDSSPLSGDLLAFFNESENRGYWDSTTKSYDSSKSGASEFYQQFAAGIGEFGIGDKGALRKSWCQATDQSWLDVSFNTHHVMRPGIDYEEYVDDSKTLCQSSEQTTSSSDTDSDATEWWVWFLVSLAIILVLIGIGVGVYCFMKRRGSMYKANRDRKQSQELVATTKEAETEAVNEVLMSDQDGYDGQTVNAAD